MTNASTQPEEPPLPPLPTGGATPAQIRAALWPEYRDAFDRDYRDALAEVGRSLDLSRLHETVEYWRMRSWVTRDQAEHRRVVRHAVELITGERSPEDEPVAVTETRL